MSRCANGGWMKPIRGIFTALAGIGLALSGVLFATMIVLPARGQEGSSPRRLPSEIIALDVTPLERLPNIPFPMPPELEGVDLNKQSEESVALKSDSCLSCHIDAKDPHCKVSLRLGCTDCHGGNRGIVNPTPGSAPARPAGGPGGCPAAPASRYPTAWRNSANPTRSYTLLNRESADFVRFVNPGDLRVAHVSCGTTNCHGEVVNQSRKSMMTHSCMLWGAALYNNGAVPYKKPRHGEFYSMRGVPLRAQTNPPPTPYEESKGVLPYLDPPFRFEVSQPSNILRIFERGGKLRPEVGIPDRFADPGRPFLERLSNRGLGTENRTDPVWVSLNKTRLFDPTLNFLGTNDQPGDYRTSGCTACHVVYANDRSPIHSGPYGRFGNRGRATDEVFDDIKPDPTINKEESGHPIQHRFAKGNSIPTSQCMTCHVHPGTTVMNSYLGYTWWDLETDGDLMYPPNQPKKNAQEVVRASMANPEESGQRGLWSNPEFLANLTDLNGQMRQGQFADFHSHGWVFRAVFRRDHKGNMIDYNGNPVADVSGPNLKRGVEVVRDLQVRHAEKPDNAYLAKSRKERDAEDAHKRAGLPMHLVDIHVEKGMHCVDCHFVQDMHGNTRLQMEVRGAIEIACIDCHGSSAEVARLRTSGPASYTSNPDVQPPDPKNPLNGRDLTALRTPSGKPRFERRGGRIYQRSMVERDLVWEVVQTKDTIDVKSEHYNAKSALAKTVRVENGEMVWGELARGADGAENCAHSNKNMSCIACHSSWNPTCYGCHLPQKANTKMPQLHNEGIVSKNYTAYNWQTLRDDVFMLARDGDVTGNKIGPSRSSCAIHVTSYNGTRESIYYQQQTISAEGMSGIAFSTNVPHTFSGRASRECTSCHVSEKNDNNALLTQLMMLGTGYTNFIGKYCWVGAGGHGFYAVPVTEREEPQAVIGSNLHRLAYPEQYKEHVERNKGFLKVGFEHPGHDISEPILKPGKKSEILSLQARGEYLYAACGEMGLRVFDIAFTDHKGFSERSSTAPVSPIGQRFFVRTRYATSVAAPTTIAPDPTRKHFPENKETPVHMMYAYIYVTDKYEGLVMVAAGTLLDGDPLNNFLKRDVVFNPDNILAGADSITFHGTHAHIGCDAGLVTIDLSDPTKPKVTQVLGSPGVGRPKAMTTQGRYGFVADEHGVVTMDLSDPAHPKPVSSMPFPGIKSLYAARTYMYAAAGHRGLAIFDIQNPEDMRVDQIYDADGRINDAHDVKLGATYPSQFAYIADGKNGLRVVQLTTPDTPGSHGFSPRAHPVLVSNFKLALGGHAVCIAKGIDRDRAVDEAGNQISVFGRLGARPFNLEEMNKLYLRDGKIWRVSNDPAWAGYTLRRSKSQRRRKAVSGS